MKHFGLGLLSGAALVTGAAIWGAGSFPRVFCFGFLAGLAALLVAFRLVGWGRTARLFSRMAGEPLKAKKRELATPRPARVLKSGPVLRPLQQEVLSALVNLGLTFKQADRIVKEASHTNHGESFDELFRACVMMATPRKA